uniref:Uncharacterized protein n=1 Tax=Trieres chinensis TaxID=1514140 RepID=A0A7S1ZL27_TRICV|mmetsp:Transcript_28139/g.57530  ORF Transcript_28139/g.57530 Transcript_28139/m.57530 type:complete len:233 (+) Transcript_28139:3-701(+)
MDDWYVDQIGRTTCPRARHCLHVARAINLTAWLTWLRSQELFSLDWPSVDQIPPHQGSTAGLPPGIGVLLFRLLPATKADQTIMADVVVAWQTASGLCLVEALADLRLSTLSLGLHPDGHLFRGPDNKSWTSTFYRHNLLIPLLHQQLLQGDPTLQIYESLQQLLLKFYSMCSYHRGGCNHVSRRREGCVRAATPTEVYEHGRWKFTHAPDMPTHYREWDTTDRSTMTQLCM